MLQTMVNSAWPIWKKAAPATETVAKILKEVHKLSMSQSNTNTVETKVMFAFT